MHITLRQLSKSFPFSGDKALNQVKLHLKPGQIIAVLGDNGSGKTTMLRCLATLYSPDEGEILFGGEPLHRDRLDLRKRMALVPDNPLTPVSPFSMTALQHIAILLRLYDVAPEKAEEQVVSLLKDFDLLPLIDRPLQSLSRGQAYKVALTAVLAVDAELWMFDEPFASGMDPRGISCFRQHCRNAAARQRTIIYTTQIVEIAERFADVICVLRGGELHAVGGPSELRRCAEQGDDVLAHVFTAEPSAPTAAMPS